MKIQFSPPDISDLEIDEVIEALKSGWITTGPRTKLFEKRIVEYYGTDKAVCLNSATAGLELVLKVLGVGPGDEVITSAYTYTASASVISHVGATIVLCDTAPDSYEMDYDKLPNLITNKTKVIIPIDIAGTICDYERIFEIVEQEKGKFKPNNDLQALFDRIVVLGDCAHSFGAVKNGVLLQRAELLHGNILTVWIMNGYITNLCYGVCTDKAKMLLQKRKSVLGSTISNTWDKNAI